MDSDDSSSYNDPGMNMDNAPASPEIPSANMEPIPNNNDHPGALTGQSSSSHPQASSSIHLRCVNCGINISRMRRHPLVIADVRCLIQRWIEPQQVQVTSDSLVCHCCWIAAWNEIRDPTPAGQLRVSTVGHTHVCVSCGSSLLRRRPHTLRSDIPRENLIRNEVARQVTPSELSRSASICHTCWRRIDRAVSQILTERDIPAEDISLAEIENPGIIQSAEEESVDTIVLPNYVRAPATQRHCFLPNCNNSQRLTVPNDLRVRLFCDYNFYVPPDCRICPRHLSNHTWDLLVDSLENPIHTFNARHIEEFASLLKNNMLNHLDFDNINDMPDHIVHYYLGFSKDQFLDILRNVPRLSSKSRGSLALAAYLIKLRTGDSDERISALLKVPRSTLERYMTEAREFLTQDFVSRNLGVNNISRAEIAARNLVIPGGLYQGDNRSPIVIVDGTYFY